MKRQPTSVFQIAVPATMLLLLLLAIALAAQVLGAG